MIQRCFKDLMSVIMVGEMDPPGDRMKLIDRMNIPNIMILRLVAWHESHDASQRNLVGVKIREQVCRG